MIIYAKKSDLDPDMIEIYTQSGTDVWLWAVVHEDCFSTDDDIYKSLDKNAVTRLSLELFDDESEAKNI